MPKLTTNRPTQLGLYWFRFPATSISVPFFHNWRAAIIDRMRGDIVPHVVDFPGYILKLDASYWDDAEWFGPMPSPDDPWPTAGRIADADADRKRLDFLGQDVAEIKVKRISDTWTLTVWMLDGFRYDGQSLNLRAAIDEAIANADEDAAGGWGEPRHNEDEL